MIERFSPPCRFAAFALAGLIGACAPSAGGTAATSPVPAVGRSLQEAPDQTRGSDGQQIARSATPVYTAPSPYPPQDYAPQDYAPQGYAPQGYAPPPAYTAPPVPQPPARQIVSVSERRDIWIVGDEAMVEDAETVLSISGFPDLKTDGDGAAAGAQAFCAGVGFQTPDILMLDRAMTADEQAACEANNITFNSKEGLGGFIAIKDAHAALVPNLSDAFGQLQ